MFRKSLTLTRILKHGGLKGVFELLLFKAESFLGSLIEKQDNRAELGGCSFSVDSPSIPTEVKGLFFFNRYERPERKALQRFLNPNLPVVEFGGAIGVVACITNKRLEYPNQHVVVEANPDLLRLLKENRDRNTCAFSIVPQAVAYDCAETTFYRSPNYLGSSLEVQSGLPVQIKTVTLLQILEKFGFETCTLICDIEGGELELVNKESEVLRDRVKTLILEIHDWILGPVAVEQLLARLKSLGFCRVYHKKFNHVFANDSL
jgi:FkbM family methyltransferase